MDKTRLHQWRDNIIANEDLSYGSLKTLNDMVNEYDAALDRAEKEIEELKYELKCWKTPDNILIQQLTSLRAVLECAKKTLEYILIYLEHGEGSSPNGARYIDVLDKIKEQLQAIAQVDKGEK